MRKRTLKSHGLKLLHARRALISASLVVFFMAGLWILDTCFPLHLPNQDALFAQVVVDASGEPLRAFPDDKGIWRYPVTLETVSPLYLESLIAYEDKRFWHHPGIDPFALARAAYLNIRHGKLVSGGSTLSMQTARLLHPHSRTLRGKLYQMLRTLQLEWHLSKEEILTLYCNIAPFGGTIEGVQAASYSYLNKSAKNLTHAEAALLTVLPQAPSRLRPDRHFKRAEQARNKVLDRMVQQNVWQASLVEAAKLEQVYATRVRPPMNAPLLSRKLITSENNKHAALIQTTVQAEVQHALADYVSEFITRQGDTTSAAVMIVDNRSAEVIAYAGTAAFADIKRHGHIDMASAIRSPGSTLKPFVYGLALEQGLIHSESLLSDTPKQFNDYRPANFSGQFMGPVSAADALQRSLNIPAVDLLSRLTAKSVYDKLSHAGMRLKLHQAEPNLSIVLGGIGTNLASLVSAYSGLARGGQMPTLRYTKHEAKQPDRYLLSPAAAWVVYTMLKDVPAPDSLPGARALVSRPSFAWKTGTSYGHRDTWALGFDARYTIGVWVGRPDGTPMPGATGRHVAGRLLHALAEQFDLGQHPIPKPESVRQQSICWPLGYSKDVTPLDHCHRTLTAWTIKGVAPPTLSDQSQAIEPNPLPIWVKTSAKTQQVIWTAPFCSHPLKPDNVKTQRQAIALWPASMDAWLPKHHRRAQLLPKTDPLCSPPYAVGTSLDITSLKPNMLVSMPSDSPSTPTLELLTNAHLGSIYWYINGVFFQRTDPRKSVQLALSKRGINQIIAVDEFGRTALSEVYWR